MEPVRSEAQRQEELGEVRALRQEVQGLRTLLLDRATSNRRGEGLDAS
jgi:hypothetical protein